jgi:GNAT superfamily N-acetyltransferase
VSATQFRSASPEDGDPIQKLAVQLGYNPTKETVLAGLQTMQGNPDYEVVVIVDGGSVVGWMTLCIRHRIEDVAFLQVAAIVTEEAHRGTGLGKQLMQYAESKAKEKQLPFVGLHSSKRREDAHRFYEKTGYSKAKESFFFSKDLT